MELVIIAVTLKLALWSTLNVLTSATFDLTLLHTNDVHARFEQFNKFGTRCSSEEAAEEGACFGGVARRMTMLKKLRREHSNILFLDGGDQYQGTLWFYYHKGHAAAYFMQLLGYDAMAIGNHEFDLEVKGLIPFLDNVTFPVLSSNIDATDEPSIEGKFEKSTVLTVAGKRIGIVGYTWHETPSVSKTGDLRFTDEVQAVQAEVDKFVADGIDVIIAVGHSGIEIDKRIAREVRNLDIVVGGHSDTFLYTGEPPSTEVPYDVYPIVVNPTHSPVDVCLVVQDYTFGKYLGFLQITFDDEGKVQEWNGNPILLDDKVEQDPEVLRKVEEMGRAVAETFETTVGQSYVTLDGERASCRSRECNLGNLITDAMLAEQITYMGNGGWTDVSMAMMNSGGIRSSIGHGEVTLGDVNTVLPFGNTNNVAEIKGKYIVEALEHSVRDYSTVTLPGSFFQVSGMRIKYNLERQPGHRVVSIEVVCTSCSIPVYEPLDPEKVYLVVMQSFLSNGGDGYTMLSNNIISLTSGNLDSTALANYIESHSPVHPYVEGRLIFVNDVTNDDEDGDEDKETQGDDDVTCSSERMASLQIVILAISTTCTILTRNLTL